MSHTYWVLCFGHPSSHLTGNLVLGVPVYFPEQERNSSATDAQSLASNIIFLLLPPLLALSPRLSPHSNSTRSCPLLTTRPPRTRAQTHTYKQPAHPRHVPRPLPCKPLLIPRDPSSPPHYPTPLHLQHLRLQALHNFFSASPSS